MVQATRNSDPVVIVGAARTPLAAFQGALAGVSAPDLGATAVRAAWQRAGIKPQDVDEVLMGCVLSAGLGQAPARQAALAAGIPDSAGGTTINKMCGSGMKAVMQGVDAIGAGRGSSASARGRGTTAVPPAS
jgi:acetyl-CoA C-acetyltransferase